METIEPGKSKVVPVKFRPDLEEDMNIVAIVKTDGDTNVANDTTKVHTISILPEGTMPFNVHVEGNYPGQDTRIPMSFMTNQSTCQIIYLASELGNPDDSKITRLSYEYNSDNAETLGPVSVMIYMSNTDRASYATTDELIQTSNQELVCEAQASINPGNDQKMVFNFSTPFEYKKGKNLCVTTVKSGLVGKEFPALFKIYNDSWNAPANTPKRTVRIDNGSNLMTNIPITNLAVVNKTSGLEKEITVASAMWYDSENRTLNFNGSQIRKAQLYDVSGKLVASYNVNGVASYRLNVKQGLYVVRALTVEGENVSVKLNIGK